MDAERQHGRGTGPSDWESFDMNLKRGMKIRWKGEDGFQGMTYGEIYTFRREESGKVRIWEDGDAARFYPPEQFEAVEVTPGAKVRWRGKTDFIMLNHNQVYTVLSVEKEWYRVIDNSGEDYLYPPEGFDLVENGQ